MLLVIGLGNPGSQYIGTRHNIGFEVVSSLARYFKVDFTKKEKFDSDIALASVGDEKILFVKPLTYMNLSGFAVNSLKNYYKISQHDIVIIHDEIDIDLGRVKAKVGGGHAGHNGIKSIDHSIGNDYLRLRIGVGRPTQDFPISAWVLEKFSKHESIIIEKVIKLLIDNFSLVMKRDIIEINKIFTRDYGI